MVRANYQGARVNGSQTHRPTPAHRERAALYFELLEFERELEIHRLALEEQVYIGKVLREKRKRETLNTSFLVVKDKETPHVFHRNWDVGDFPGEAEDLKSV